MSLGTALSVSCAFAFAAVQANADGAALYQQHCGECHGPTLKGTAHGTELSGRAFAERWGELGLAAFVAHSAATMPPGEVNSLQPAQYQAVAEYVFAANELAAAAGEATNSWSGAAGIAEMARSGSHFANQIVEDLTPVSQAELNRPPAGDWLSWRRTLDGHAETPLTQISPDNVHQLTLAWATAMHDGSNQVTPLVRDGVMFLLHPGLVIQALAADTGDLIWQYEYPFPDDAQTLGGPMRNFAIYQDKLFIATYDAALIALDARSGELLWRTQKADYKQGYTHSAGPIIANGVVVSGINGCERYKKDGCFITGHDPETGRELWRTSTIQQPGSPQDTWAGLPAEFRAGGDAWIAGSYDAALDLFFIGTSQAKPWVAASRGMRVADSALYTNATLALRPKTGEIVWYYQHIPGETIDMEVGFERVVATVGDQRFVFTVGKDGILWQLDAATGAYVAHIETMPQDIFSHIDPEDGRVTYREDIQKAGVGERFSVCPGIYGGHNWQSMAYSSITDRLIIPLHQLCGEMTGRPVDMALGDGGFGGDSKSFPMPGVGDQLGKLVAIDVKDGSLAWSLQQAAMFMTGVLTTKSGLLFVGDLDRRLKALDVQTGKVLWQTRLGAPTHGYPISYSVGDRQFVAVPTGMGVFRAMTSVVSPQIYQPSNGQALYVFALPIARE